MSQHPDTNDSVNSTATTDEHTPNSTSKAIDTDNTANQEIEPNADKHIRIVNTFMKRRTHMNKNAELALRWHEFFKYIVNDSFVDGDRCGIDDLRALFADSPNGADPPLT